MLRYTRHIHVDKDGEDAKLIPKHTHNETSHNDSIQSGHTASG